MSSYLAECINITEGLGPVHKKLLDTEGQRLGASPAIISSILARADDTIHWANEMRLENYHRTNVLAFLSMWATHEAGYENIFTAILSTIKTAAESVSEKFPAGKYRMTDWPWTEDRCLEITQKLDHKAKEKTPDGGWDAAARLITLCGWVGIDIAIPPQSSAKFNEASMIRNVLVHRYGRLGARDVARVPHLAEYQNKAVQLTAARLAEYQQAVFDVYVITHKAILTTGWK